MRYEDKSLRRRAIGLIEDWWHADREASTSSTHPLVTVQELHLTDGEGKTVRGSQKRSGRSRPLIRDLPYELRWMDGVMTHVAECNPYWRKALEGFAEHGSIRKAADNRKVKPSILFRDFNQGVTVVISELVRRGM